MNTRKTPIPTPAISLSFLSRGSRARVPRALLREGVQRVAAWRKTPEAEIHFVMMDAVRIRALNRRFRGVDRETDVMAFRYEGRKNQLIGDVVICLPVAERQAKAAGHSVDREILYLGLHGVLHLYGFTDYDPRSKREMFRWQNHFFRQVPGGTR